MADRETLIELLEGAKNSREIFCTSRLYCSELIVDHLIANGVTVQEWIPVTERLPEADAGDVLCITPGGHYKVLQWLETFGCWSDPGGIDFTNFKRGYVTHWMPLPQPPKGE